MCIACEMGFWMAMEEAPPERDPRKAAHEQSAFACEAPESLAGRSVKRAAASKPRKRGKTSIKTISERRP